MSYDLSEHRHRFAVWAAARAAQRGFTTVENLRDALEVTEIRSTLSTLVAVYLKAIVVLGDGCHSPLGRNLHPPIDRILLHSLAASDNITSPHKEAWRSTNWTQLDEWPILD